MWKQIKVFGLRYWSISELEENFWKPTQSSIWKQKNNEPRAQSEKK